MADIHDIHNRLKVEMMTWLETYNNKKFTQVADPRLRIYTVKGCYIKNVDFKKADCFLMVKFDRGLAHMEMPLEAFMRSFERSECKWIK